MPEEAASPALFFTFSSSITASGHMAVEAVATEIVEEDRSVAPDAYKRYWFGSESELEAMFAKLGFSALDQEGILASLHSHRDVARKLEIDQAQVENAGFVELAKG